MKGIAFHWIADRRTDLTWYVGSALAGWFYVALILLLGRGLADPLNDPLWTVSLFGSELPITLTVLVFWSWAFLLDGPHLWATLGRTLLDPDEWQVRRREIRRSFWVFALGPVAVLSPYLLAAGAGLVGLSFPMGSLAIGYYVFFTFFKLWAYYHVVRQHWGFFRLYKSKADDFDPRWERLDTWFFNLMLYLPLLLFFTAPFYLQTPGFYPDLGLQRSLAGGLTLAGIFRPLFWSLYVAALGAYALSLWKRRSEGETINGAKLAFLLSIVPLHLIVYAASPLLAAFVIPIVTVGHNIQYHRIIWDYARKKYYADGKKTAQRYPWARRAFSSWLTYGVIGIVFTFACYRGPWIIWLRKALGGLIDDSIVNASLSAAGFGGASYSGVGESVAFAFIIGWALQHYYLDSKIWRVSSDPEVRRLLGVEKD